MNELLGGIFGLMLCLCLAYWFFWPKEKPITEKQQPEEIGKRGQYAIDANVKPNQKLQHNHVPIPKSTRNVRRSDDTGSDDFMSPLNPISPNYIGNYSAPISEHRSHDCHSGHSGHSYDYGGSSYSSSDSCSSSSDSSSSSSSGD